MSIATLKKKSNNIHGSFRNQNYTGNNLSKHYPRTLMKGNTARGSGGCCGKYNNVSIVKSDGFTTENISIVKSSVVGNMGMLKMKYRWITRPQPFTTVKPKDVIQCCSAECNFIM